MAWIVVKKTENGVDAKGNHEYMVSGQSDLANIPQDGLRAGDVAYKEDLSAVWMYDIDGDWNQI